MRHRPLLPLLLAATLALGTAPAPLAADRDEIPVPADKSAIQMNFEDVELTAFIKFISKVTGRNIVFGDKIEGTVSVVSPTPVDSEQAFAMFQSVLATQGLTTIDEGAVMRIVATKDARTAGGEVVGGAGPPAGFATRLIPLRYVGAADVARVLAPQVSKDASIVPYEGTNTVIVSDTAANLARIAEMVAVMDVPGHEQGIAVLQLKHAEAVRTSEQILEILLGGTGRRRGGGGGEDKEKRENSATLSLGFRITPDERTNSLVVMAPAVEMARIKELARGLDTELRPGEERVHVYYARNADAEALVEVLSAMITGSKGRNRRDRDRSSRDSGGSSLSQPASTGGLSQAGTPPGASDEDVSITADAATNAVIVEGPAQEWKTILSLLQKLDIPRPQVFIEAIIVEASANRAKALGFDYQAAIDVGAGDILMRSNIAQLGQAFVNPLALGGLVAAAASDNTVTLPDGTELPANYALLQALDTTSDINVLSAPTLLTLDNQEAEIIVGQNIPFVTGQAADLSKIENVFTTVERKDVGIKLRVRPQVAEGDLVVLEVNQEVSAVVRTVANDLQTLRVGPTTTIRSASTTVSVGDGRTVVIGGLISNRTEEGESRVPILGDIPWIGRLFRYERKDKDKVNLIIFLTPHVVRSPKDLDFVSKARRERFRDELGQDRGLLPEDSRGPGDAEAPAPPGAAAPRGTKQGPAVAAPAQAAAPARAAPASDAPRHASTYRHAADEKAEHLYPLNKDTRDRAPF